MDGLTGCRFGRSEGFQAERVDLMRQVVLKDGVNLSLARHTVKPFEGLGNNQHRKMTLAPFTGTGMTTMLGTVVVNLKVLRREGFGQFRSDVFRNGSHDLASFVWLDTRRFSSLC